jgi:hypothetical protein
MPEVGGRSHKIELAVPVPPLFRLQTSLLITPSQMSDIAAALHRFRFPTSDL